MRNGEATGSTTLATLRGLALHLLIVSGALAALLLVTPVGDIALPDEGVYLAQASALVDGDWWVGRALPNAAPSDYVDAVMPEVSRDDRMVPYARHPLFPVLLAPVYALAGPHGAILLTLAALLATAVASARVAAHVEARATIPTFYLVALGSPLLFSGWQVSAHAPAAAGAACAALAAIHCLRRARPTWYLALVVGIATCVMTRSEGVLLCAVGSMLLLGIGATAPLGSRRAQPAITVGIVATISTIAAFLTDAWWSRAVSGSTSSGLDRLEPMHRSPARAAWIGLLQPWDGSATTANRFLILAVVAIVAAALAWRLAPRRTLAAWGLLTLAVVAAVVGHASQPALLNGLLPAFPLLVAGLVLADGSSLRDPILGGLMATAATTAVVLCFVIYEDGGATQWGGRFFHMLIPLLAPAVATFGVRSLARVAPRPRRAAITGTVVVALLVTAMGVRTEIRFRGIHREIRLAAERMVGAVASRLSDRSVLVVATPVNDGLSRTFWRRNTEFVTIRSANASTFRLLRALQDQGLDSAYVLTPGDVELMEFGGRIELERLGWERLESHRIPGMSVRVLRYGPARALAR